MCAVTEGRQINNRFERPCPTVYAERSVYITVGYTFVNFGEKRLCLLLISLICALQCSILSTPSAFTDVLASPQLQESMKV